ncbi:hypothetical protein D8674_037704 [Pyrus ussuriensis x Pyrus communis]|uniref:Uncharacterized protein n=1 Tax=Pyrus ussuriensis x Pyrus communis TaxID=2448454 RepID=A0A5N5HC56_9ROSA|nr:hypothetical protein D8674_037704 [Pyrus ussuriensis x Pyrus communis]
MNMLMVLDVVGKSIEEILVMDNCDDSIVQLPTNIKCGSHSIHNYMSCEWDNYIAFEGQIFRGDCADFRYKLKKFSVKCGVDLNNDKNHISVECSRKESDGCL